MRTPSLRGVVWLAVFLMLALPALAYTAPDYRDVTLTLAPDYTAPSLTDVPLVFGEGENRAPVFDFALENQEAVTGEDFSYDVNCSDPDGDPLEYSQNATDLGVVIDSTTGLIEWTPDNDDIDTHTIEVTCSDGITTASQSFDITVEQKVSAEVKSSDITFSNNNPELFEQVTVYAEVTNEGDTTLTDVLVRFYDGEEVLGEDSLSMIAQGTSQSASITQGFDREGFHLIRIIVDPENTINETNEDNNYASRSLLVGTLQDVGSIILTAGLSPSNPYVGHGYTVSGKGLYNTTYGWGSAVEGAQVRIVVKDEYGDVVDSTTTYSLATGVFSIGRTAPFTNGTYNVTVTMTDFTFQDTVELTLTVRELPEEEEIPPKPDIAVYRHEIWFNESKPVEGDSVTVFVRVRNIGNNYSVPFNVTMRHGNTILGEFRLESGLAAGASEVLSASWIAEPKYTQTINVFADSLNEVTPEWNEGNNHANRPIYVYPNKPDLTPTKLKLSDPKPAQGQSINIFHEITNIGGSDAIDTTTQIFDNSTKELIGEGERNSPIIEEKFGLSSFSETYSFTDTGYHDLLLTGDYYNVSDEDREGNNEYLLRIYVHAPGIDLTPTLIWFSDSNPLNNTNITVYVQITNIGEEDASNVVIAFNDSYTGFNEMFATRTIVSLPAGSSEVVSTQLNATPTGKHTIIVHADPDNAIAEHSDANNILSKYLYVRSPVGPALEIHSDNIAFSNDNPDEDENVIIEATVRNLNLETAAYNVSVQFEDMDATGQISGMQSIPYLAPGGSETVSVTWSAAGVGSHVIQVWVDRQNLIDESGLGKWDNNATQALIVGKIVDFAVFEQDIYFIDMPSLGEEGTLYVNISNIGTDTGNATVNISIDGIVNWTQQVDNLVGKSWTLLSIPFTPTAQAHNISVEIYNVTPYEWYPLNNDAEKEFSFNTWPSINISSQTIYEDTPEIINLSEYASDSDGDELTFTIIGENALFVDCEIDGENLTMTPALNWFGESFCEVQTNDGFGGLNSSNFTITVLSVNDAPNITGIPDNSTLEDTTPPHHWYDLTGFTTDVDNVTEHFTWDIESQSNLGLIDCFISDGQYLNCSTPAANQTGSSTVIVNVTDGINWDSDTFVVIVTEVNDPPVISDIPDNSTPEDTAPLSHWYDLRGFTLDPDNLTAELTWYVKSQDNAVLIDCFVTDTYYLDCGTPAANQTGSNTITVNVTDGIEWDSDTFVVTVTPVNDPPEWINDVPTANIIEDAEIAEHDNDLAATPQGYCWDVDNTPVELSFTVEAQNPVEVVCTINDSKQLLLEPASDWYGLSSCTVRCSDAEFFDDSAFNIDVASVNDPVNIADVLDRDTDEDTTPLHHWLDLSVYTTDGDNTTAQLTWYVESQSNDALIDCFITGEYYVNCSTPAANQTGTSTIVVNVTDGITWDSDDFVVTVNPVNDAPQVTDPVLSPPAPKTLDTITAQTTVTDADPADVLSVTFTWRVEGSVVYTEAVTGLSNGASPSASLAPANYTKGQTVNITVVANDNIVDSIAKSAEVTVVDTQPSWTGLIPDGELNEDDLTTVHDANLSITPGGVCYDPDFTDGVDALTFTVQAENAVEVDCEIAESYKLQHTPAPDWYGTASCTIRCSDGTTNVDDTYDIKVTSVNDAPVWEVGIPPANINEDAAIVEHDADLTASPGGLCSDIDNSSSELSFTITAENSAEVHCIINGTQLLIEPAPDWYGLASCTVQCSDGQLTDDSAFDITVASVNDPVSISGIPDNSTSEDTAPPVHWYDLNGFTTDVDNTTAELTWSVESQDNAVLINCYIADVYFVNCDTPAPNSTGTNLVTVNVTDGITWSSDSFTVTVTPVNDHPDVTVPELSPLSPMTEDDITASTTVTDVDLDTLSATFTWYVDSAPAYSEVIAGLSSGSVAAAILSSANYTKGQTVRLEVFANDGLLDSSTESAETLIVDTAPLWQQPIPDDTIYEDDPSMQHDADLAATPEGWCYDPDYVDGVDTLTFSVQAENTAEVDCSTLGNVLYHEPAADWYGIASCTIRCTDSTTNVDYTYSIEVLSVNDAPVIDGVPTQTVDEDTTPQDNWYDLSLYTMDIDNSTAELTWSVESQSNPGLISCFIKEGTQHILNCSTPAQNQYGVNEITVSVTDGIASDSTTFTVEVASVNDAPIIDAVPDVYTDEDTTPLNRFVDLLSYTSDVDNATADLVWSIDSQSNPGLIDCFITETHYVNCSTPAPNASGMNSVTVQVSDGIDTDTDTFDVIVQPVNDAPEVDLLAIEPTIIEEDTSVEINLSNYVFDIDNTDAEMDWECTSNESNVIPTVDNIENTLDLSAVNNWNGNALVTCTATDPGLLSDTDSFTVQVTAVNDPPVLDSIGNQVALQNQTYTLILSGTDVDSPDLNFSANTTLFSVEKLNVTHARVQFMPTWEQRGDHSIRFTVTDGELEGYEDIRFLIRGFRIELRVGEQDVQVVKSGYANTTVRYNMSIENFGNTADTVSLSLEKQQGWITRFLDESEIEITNLTVDSLGTRYPFFEVDVPANVSPPDSNDIIVVATSENGVMNDSVLTVTSVGGVPSVEITQLEMDKGSYRLTDTAELTVKVDNTGGVLVKNLTVETTIMNASGIVVFSETEFIAELSNYQMYTYTTGFNSPGTHTLESIVSAQSGLEYDRRSTVFNVGLPFIESFTTKSLVYKPNGTEKYGEGLFTMKARNYDDISHDVYINFTVTDADGTQYKNMSSVITLTPNAAQAIGFAYNDTGAIGKYYADAVLIASGTDEVLDTATLEFWVTEAHFSIIDGIVTESGTYGAGEVVDVIGTVEDKHIPVDVNYTLFNPSGAVVNRSENFLITATPPGTEVPYAFTLPPDAELGQWRILGTVHKLGVVLHEYDGYFIVTSYDASAVIGAAGGELVNPAGTMKIIVPPGALANNTLINITHNSAQDGYTMVGNSAHGYSYDLFPKGGVFSLPVTLVMTYSDAEVGSDESKLDIKLRNLAGNKWIAQGATLDTVENTLTLNVTEFLVRAP